MSITAGGVTLHLSITVVDPARDRTAVPAERACSIVNAGLDYTTVAPQVCLTRLPGQAVELPLIAIVPLLSQSLGYPTKNPELLTPPRRFEQ